MVDVIVLHVPHVIIAVHLVAYPLFDHLSALIIQHPLMSCFLEAGLRVLVHLVPLADLLSIPAYCLLLLSLVTLRDRVTILVHLSRLHKGLFDHMSPSASSSHTGKGNQLESLTLSLPFASAASSASSSGPSGQTPLYYGQQRKGH